MRSSPLMKLNGFYSGTKGPNTSLVIHSDEAIGQPLTLIIPHQLHERHGEGIERMNQEKEASRSGKGS